MNQATQPGTLSEKDQKAVAEVRELVDRAYKAYIEFEKFSQEQVDRIIDAMAAAATKEAERLGRMATEETGYGVPADKKQKNLFSSQRVYEAIRGMKTAGLVREDRANGVMEIAEPVGVVAAIIPSTNPTSTAIYKVLIALKGRNAIVLSPHPSAVRCTCETVAVMKQAAVQAGLPADVIQCLGSATQAGTQELMRHRRTRVILATGGAGIVRAAYSSGKPAYGVGPGNVPAFIDRSADVKKAVADVVFGTTFDYGTICSSEQAIVAEESLRQQILDELKRNQAYFLNDDEIKKLGAQMVDLERHTINPKFVGKSAIKVAELAGLKVPEGTRVLIAPLAGVGREYPLSAEKLSPVLALYFVKSRDEAMNTCLSILRFGGLGHTCAIHARDEAVIREYGLRMPAGRIVVNSPSPMGSIGLSTNVFPAMTLGCGAVGGNITSDNIGPMHLVNLKRVAIEQRPVTAKETVKVEYASAPAAVTAEISCGCVHEAPAAGSPERAAVSRAIDRFLSSKRSATSVATPQPAQASKPETPVAPKPPLIKPRPVDFVSEAEVRAAMKRKEKILIGRKTMITPSARDLAEQHDVFTMSE